MFFFQRSIHSNVREVEDGHWLVNSDFLDLEHSFHIELRIRVSDGFISSARAVMSDVPFLKCRRAEKAVSELAGRSIDRGILTYVNNRIGGSEGCAHLAELANDAVRLVAMLRIRTQTGYLDPGLDLLTEDEKIERLTPKLKNTCLVFCDPK